MTPCTRRFPVGEDRVRAVAAEAERARCRPGAVVEAADPAAERQVRSGRPVRRGVSGSRGALAE
ncbi:hypothetical protein GCM10010266_50890 [Streptomyces griseomycini]|nr:hypothetical protein GCM10010266_50890 [Streptomyces griseomycini]GGR52961.1 hypothetical protein GCM10015536_68020 [Streptomyces griseomycini]